MSVRYAIQNIHFEWDAPKAAANRRKHGVEFETACEAFFDPYLRTFDAGAEGGEAREGILGFTAQGLLLYVVFVEREDVFRIISARRATRMERTTYENQ